MKTKKIATHNSVTGERGKGFLSWLVTPFSRCQKKTIGEQFKAGCRYFDLRVRKDKHGWLEFAHGLWTADASIHDVLDLLNLKAKNEGEEVFVSLTYEGKDREAITAFTEGMIKCFKYLRVTTVNVKYPKWETLKVYNECPLQADYAILDGRDARTLLPLPWLWNKLRRRKHDFDEETFTMVDFL